MGHRPRVVHNLNGGLGDTTYQQEYDKKLQAHQDPRDHDWMLQKTAKPDPIRSGTASGNRRNNPHPSKVKALCVQVNRGNQWWIKDFSDWGRQPQGGATNNYGESASLLLGQMLPKNYMEMKKIGLRWEGRVPAPPLPIRIRQWQWFTSAVHSFILCW